LAGVEDVGVGREHAVGEIGLPQILPDVLGWIEFWTGGLQRHEGDIGGWVEFARRMPSGLVEDQQRVCAGAVAGLHSNGPRSSV